MGQAVGTIIAELSVTVTARGVTNFTLHKIACAVNCGIAVDPDSVEALVQGGIFDGLTAAKWGELK